MTRYVCIGCGSESSDDKLAGEPCPYCGELMAKESKALTQEIEAE